MDNYPKLSKDRVKKINKISFFFLQTSYTILFAFKISSSIIYPPSIKNDSVSKIIEPISYSPFINKFAKTSDNILYMHPYDLPSLLELI
jgi:hypothetical protein